MDVNNLRILRYYLAINYQGDCKPEDFEAIERYLNIGNIKSYVEWSPRLFWICKHSNDKWHIRLKIDVKFCIKYQNTKCPGNCRCLHLCKYFVIADTFCASPCKFGFSHDISDAHNNQVWLSVSPELFTLDPSLKLKIIRNSFPRVCCDFKNGKCHDLFCGKFHICSKFIFGLCIAGTDCELSKSNGLPKGAVHNLISDHNMAVLNMFNLSHQKCDREILVANILLRKYIKDSSEVNNTVVVANSSSMLQNLTQPPLMLCYSYLHSNCKNIYCTGLHICKEFLVNKCPKTICKFGFSHNLSDKHNYVVIKTHELQKYSKETLLDIIQKKLPWICQNYQISGKCDDSDCKNMHVCLRFASDTCYVDNCKFSHDLKDIHNLKVLKYYWLDKIDDIKTNILFSRFGKIPECSINPNVAQNSAASVLQKSSPLHNTGKKNVQQTSSLTKDDPKEKDIFLYMIESFPTCNCNLDDLLLFFGGDKVKAEEWFSDHLSSFRLVRCSRNNITVHICISELKPCQFYWSKDGCNKSSTCTLFHICKQLLLNISHCSITCQHNHQIIHMHQKLVIEKKLDSLTEDQLLALLRCRYPSICMKYLEQSCELTEEFCPNLHVCYEYMQNKCKKQTGLCDYKHENGLTGVQASRLIKEYHLHEKLFKYCVLLPERDLQFIDSKEITSVFGFNPLREEAICDQYVTNKCMDVSTCQLQHANSTYVWQYKSPGDGAWKSLSSIDNTKVERKYCDPANNSYDSGNIYILFDDINYDFNGKYATCDAIFRRLSTKSSAIASGEVGPTEWKWYWCRNPRDWVEYCLGTSSYDIEINFLNNHIDTPMVYQFELNEYVILFNTMRQENLDTLGDARIIRRRPLFQEKIQHNALSMKSITPSHWADDCKGERVKVGEPLYSKLESEFKKSISRKIIVVNIEEVCNAEHYRKYEAKKKMLSKKLPGFVIEHSLYHGTSADIIDDLCAQNFDWRLCGKNATVYGLGSYFAVNADYSHNYVKADSHNICYIFRADVLVGKYALGSRLLTHPPAISLDNPHELFDSVVNSVELPSIFVIFERDQCYPRYLISYKTWDNAFHI